MSARVRPTQFGVLLREGRRSRRLSQEQLALESEVSTRHLSFLETGRARPSRSMVLLLGSALDLPLRERNMWLHAAGFAPAYGESPLDPGGEGPLRKIVERILAQQEPYPAEPESIRELIDAVVAYPGALPSRESPPLGTAPAVCIDVHLRKGPVELRLFTTLTTLGTPIDVAAQELRIESYFPVDEATSAWLRARAQ